MGGNFTFSKVSETFSQRKVAAECQVFVIIQFFLVSEKRSCRKATLLSWKICCWETNFCLENLLLRHNFVAYPLRGNIKSIAATFANRKVVAERHIIANENLLVRGKCFAYKSCCWYRTLLLRTVAVKKQIF